MCKRINLYIISHYVRPYQFLKFIQMDKLVAEQKSFIQKLSVVSTEALYTLIMDRWFDV